MKTMNFWRTLFFSALAVTAFVGCKDDDDDVNNGGEVRASITVDGKSAVSLGVKNAGETKEVKVVSSGDWMLSFGEGSEWVEASAVSGNAGESTLTFTVKEDLPEGVTSRNATASLKTRGYILNTEYWAEATVTITQSESGQAGGDTNVAVVRALLKAMALSKDKQAVTDQIAAMTLTGVVVSDQAGNNFSSDAYAALQDADAAPNSGLMISCNALKTLNPKPGTVFSVSLDKAQVMTFYDVIQLSIDNSVTPTVIPGAAPDPVVITPDKLLDYEAMLVKIENCQPQAKYAGQTWGEGDNWKGVEMLTQNGQTFQIPCNKNAFLQSAQIPQQSGSVTGLGFQYLGTAQLKPRIEADLQLDQPLFEVEAQKTTIADLGTGEYEVENATIVGVHSKGVMLADDTGYVLAFNNDWTTQTSNPYLADVDKLATVKGTCAPRYGLMQFTAPEITVGGASSFKLPAPEKFDAAAIEAYTSAIAADENAAAYKYVSLTGKLTITAGSSYNTYTIAVNGCPTAIQFAYGLDTYFEGYSTGDMVDATGFALGYDTKNAKMNVLLRSIAKNASAPALTFTKTPDAFAAENPEAQTLTFTTQNVSGSIDFSFDDLGMYFDVLAQDATSVTINAIGNNTTDAALTATLTATYNGETLATLAVKQLAPVQGDLGPAYVWTTAKDQVKQAGGTIEVGEPAMEWTTTAADYIGFDTSSYKKGLQIGSSKKPAAEFILSTDAYSGKIGSIVVDSAIGSGGDGKLTVKIGGTQIGETIALVLDSAPYTFTPAAPVEGKIEIILQASAKAMYIKSVKINPAE